MNDTKSIIRARKILNAIQIVAATIFWIALGISTALWVLNTQIPASQLIAVVVVLVGIGIALHRVVSIAYDPILGLLANSDVVNEKIENLEAAVTGKPRPKKEEDKLVTSKPVRKELEEASAQAAPKSFFEKLFGEKKEAAPKAEAPKAEKTEKTVKSVKTEKEEKKPAAKTNAKAAPKAEAKAETKAPAKKTPSKSVKEEKAEKPAAKAKTAKAEKPAAKKTAGKAAKK